MKNQILQALFAFVVVLSPVVRAAEPAPRDSVKLLTIGNSFADNSTHFLPAMSEAGGKKLTLFRANLGGHSFQQHAGYMNAFEANPDDPKGRPYGQKVDPVTKERTGGASLREALQKDQWDIVTIQQVSQLSPRYESYQPYADQLIACIKRYAPQARILIHETWPYPADCARYQEPKLSYLKDPETMYQNLKASYGRLSAENSFGMIRVGDAFHAVMTGPDPLRLHGFAKEGKGDIHANANGQFLGAAMFYEAIFNDSVLNNPYVPKDVTPEDAKRLREIAHANPVQAAAAVK